MEPLRVHTGVVAPLDRADVDTDQIIPKQFLKRIERSGYGAFLFYDWRRDAAAAPGADFVLDRAEYAGASVLVTGRNFGCGSSREHAAWALLDHGIRAVVAPSFADIFRTNADQNGLLTVELPESTVRTLLERAEARAPYTLTLDVERRRVQDGQGIDEAFEIDDFRRTCLLEGLDRIGLTLRHEAKITAFEGNRAG